jgi:hypothetical protein
MMEGEFVMRSLLLLAVGALWTVLLAPASWAQGNGLFTQPFIYSDAQGTGTLRLTAVNNGSNRPLQPLSAVLTQGNVQYSGTGIYSAFVQPGASLPATTYLAFTVADRSGRSYFYEANVDANASGGGTYWLLSNPAQTFSWRISRGSPSPGPGSIVDSKPQLTRGWTRNTSADAIGGVYYGTFNTIQGVEDTASWTGNVPRDGNYRVEVYIPKQTSPGFTARTRKARYQIFEGPFGSERTAQLDQDVVQAAWVPLGTYNFRGSYRIILTDETGEQKGTRSVVANAVRVTPVQ